MMTMNKIKVIFRKDKQGEVCAILPDAKKRDMDKHPVSITERHDKIVIRLLKFFALVWYRNYWLTWHRQSRTRTEYIELIEIAKKDPEQLKQIIQNRRNRNA